MTDANARPAANRAAGTSPFAIALIFVQLVALLLVLDKADVLGTAYRRVVTVAVAGFLVNSLLPQRFRLAFFTLLSVGTLVLILGTPVTPGQFWDPAVAVPRAGLILGIGGVLIGICHLPIGFWIRAALLAAAGVLLACFRSGRLPSGGYDIVWILVPAMFMFRVTVYLYDVSTTVRRPALAQTISYFFRPANACNVLFPVVDFKTFGNSHYNADAVVIYQRGVRWVVRGVVQLLLYRFVDQIFDLNASEVHNGADLFRFLIGNMLLYLNVSGSFHLISGLFLIFGFNLPETNHRYFLASSFSDYWRRVNIYWKDYIMKVFYYPAFFRLKKLGQVQALVLATGWAFFVTWVLHLYQTWWLKGSAHATWPDAIFWGFLGLLILANSLWELKRGRKRTLTASRYTAMEAIGLALRTAGVFVSLTLLWSLWSSPGVRAWLKLWRYADSSTAIGLVGVLGIVGVWKIAVDVLPGWLSPAQAGAAKPAPPPWWRDAALCLVTLGVVYTVTDLALRSRLPHFTVGQIDSQRIYDTFEAGDSLLPEDEVGELNYYKRISGLNEGNRQLVAMQYGLPMPRVPHDNNPPVVTVPDFRGYEMLPSQRLTNVYETDEFQTNRWGMRDKERELAKPANTVRIALLGSSHTMGYAVQQSQAFGSILEDRLNQQYSPAGAKARFEVLNFAHSGYSPLGQVNVMDAKVARFHPDIVILAGHAHDFGNVNYRLREAMKSDYLAVPELQQILRDAKVTKSTRTSLAEKRLKPFEPAIMTWTMKHLAAQIRENGGQPVFFLYPAVGLELPFTGESAREANEFMRIAADAGFVVVDGSHVFDGYPVEDLITGIVTHSNPKAHALLADLLYRQLTANPADALEKATLAAAKKSP